MSWQPILPQRNGEARQAPLELPREQSCALDEDRIAAKLRLEAASDQEREDGCEEQMNQSEGEGVLTLSCGE